MNGFLKIVADNLPFKAVALSHEMLEEIKLNNIEKEKSNINPYTFEYILKNNMGNFKQHAKRIDYFYFGKYV